MREKERGKSGERIILILLHFAMLPLLLRWRSLFSSIFIEIEVEGEKEKEGEGPAGAAMCV